MKCGNCGEGCGNVCIPCMNLLSRGDMDAFDKRRDLAARNPEETNVSNVQLRVFPQPSTRHGGAYRWYWRVYVDGVAAETSDDGFADKAAARAAGEALLPHAPVAS